MFNKSKTAPTEYVDFLLIKNLYRCTPSELDKQSNSIVELHVEFMNLESKENTLIANRNAQQAKLKSKNNKI